MKVIVCIGSSCHVKGSRQIVERLQNLIAENKLEDKVNLGGTFCMGECAKGVSVMIDGTLYSVSPETADSFFKEEILAKL